MTIIKKVIYVLAIAMTAIACKKEAPKNYVTLSGKITNQSSDSIVVRTRMYEKIKTIRINPNGSFSDTLNVEPGDYLLDYSNPIFSYLKNGYDLHLTFDTENFNETITFKGTGAEINNYMLKSRMLMSEKLNNKILEDLYDLDQKTFDQKLNSAMAELHELLENSQILDTAFVSQKAKSLEQMRKRITKNFNERVYLRTVLGKGKPSPKFTDYENYAGGTTSLDDLKGKYVYIDVWATWCGPCKAEIPFLKKIEKTYHGKNIEFVSISIDKEKDYQAWKKMVADKELKGVQLIADNAWNSEFIKEYRILGIPRFILIDPQGNIVTPDAPRPSNPKLIDLFNELKI
ncbi:TlpA family protein disulfide reductase [Flavobacteriaceae bacterium F08102]|nr:TlpA family protein disulfide reductase [Flavobacteriaceae bacterium F08102]